MPFKLSTTWQLALAAVAANLVSIFPGHAQDGVTPWPQAQSDLQPDQNVKFGTLANGMRFAIMRNTTPPGQASIRFRIGAGSLDENDNQQGLAHFLEHMAFKGSAHVPEGEMIRILQRKGLAFGPDTNATTSYDETVYSLDLPQVDADSISTGLMLMRETASELTLDAGAFDRERGVILSEERLRDTPQYRSGIGTINLLLEGQRASMRAPIGKTDIISNAPISLLRDYYRANYQPGRGVLMVVGDIDPAAVETEIRQRFDDWPATGPASSTPDRGSPKTTGESANIITVPGGTTSVQISWTRPYDSRPDTTAKRRAQLIEDLGLMVLKRRLAAMAEKSDAPFISAEAGEQDVLKSAHAVMVIANSGPDKWQAALSAIDQEERRIQKFGVTQGELKREIVEYRSALQAIAAGASTRTTTGIASTLASSVDNDQVFTSPTDDLSLFETITGEVTVAEINDALRVTFSGNGPQVILQTAEAPEGGAEAVRQVYARSRAVEVSRLDDATDVVWPYTNFGAPGRVVEQRTVDDLGLALVRFDNGVRLTVKPTKLRANEVLIREDVAGGRMALPPNSPAPLWATPAVVLSATKAINYQDMQKALAEKIFDINVSMGDSSVKLDGQTRPQDLEAQLQLLAAYTSDPAYRPEVFKRVQQAYLNSLDQYASTAGGVVSRDFAGLVHSSDKRWAFPDVSQISATTPQNFEESFRPLISKGSIAITIVGDVSVDEAVRLTAETFGALPKREDSPLVGPVEIHLPAADAKPLTESHSGRADSAAAVVAAPIGDRLSDIPRAAAAKVASQIFQNRLIEQFRIAEGAAYSVQGDVDLSSELSGYGYGYLYVETTPEKVDRFFTLVDKVAADLRTGTVGPDELTRAREPLVDTLKNLQQSNEYWIRSLQGVQTDPRRLNVLRSNLGDLEKVTSADVRQFATTYFQQDRFWRWQVLPAAIR